MSLDALDRSLELELEALRAEGRAKPPERVITDYLPPRDGRGPRYRLAGSDREFIRMNSNSYLSLANHPEVIRAADEATHALGVGPGAVRFIDGTFSHHVALETRIARFVGKPAAKIFNSAYTANCGLALAVSTPRPSGWATSSTTTASSAPCASPTSRRPTRRSTGTTTWTTWTNACGPCPPASSA